ncbi:MAG: 3-phosphoshikimate 1-carboxyvinyltransferase [Euryarchaeota archaeon]|nr:3-phosphoshikimate 1-carboxyvinyltransferase [Euryarchaeota archaeon]
MEALVQRVEGVEGAVEAPPSKSYTHRAFVIAALAEGRSTIRRYLKAGDTLSTLKALRAFGVRLEVGEEVAIEGTGGRLKAPPGPIDCENSGTSIRLLSSLAALDGPATLTGDQSIQRRPMGPLLEALAQLGVEARSLKGDGNPPVQVGGGGLRGGRAEIKGDVSSQFISSLLISAPYAREDVELVITTPLKSRPYVDVTLEIMGRFGVDVENRDYRRFIIPAGRRYRGQDYGVEGDYSSASYFLALAPLTKSRVRVGNLNPSSNQGDRQILAILEDMGAEVERSSGGVTVAGGRLEGIEVDLGDTPDLLPTVAVLGARAEGRTVIRNVEHARYKETDRLRACSLELRKLGARVEEARDGLVIEGGSLRGARVESYGDHRMAMAMTIAGLSADGTTIVEGVECVQISFPGFYDLIKGLCPGRVALR